MPPPTAVKAGKIAPLSDEHRRTIARWIDLGCPINLADSAFFTDENRPTLTVTFPQAGVNEQLDRILVGMHDAYSGLVEDSLFVTADFPIEGVAAGENLAPQFDRVGDGVFELKFKQPIRPRSHALLIVSVKDRQGNLTRVERSFSVRQQ